MLTESAALTLSAVYQLLDHCLAVSMHHQYNSAAGPRPGSDTMDQPDLEDVLLRAQSSDVDVRARGIQSLWSMVQKNPSLTEVALPIFRAALVQPTDGWTVSNALRGIQKLAGEAEFRSTALELANYSDAKLASRVVLMLSDPSFADELIELMRRRPDAEIQIGAMAHAGSDASSGRAESDRCKPAEYPASSARNRIAGRPRRCERHSTSGAAAE